MSSSGILRPRRSSRRPAMISELAQEAQNHNWDENGTLKYFLRIADRSRKAGKAAVENNDLETAFIMFARAATIVLEKLPVHREYHTTLTTEQRHHLQTNGADILDHLSKLKPILQDRHDKWSLAHPDEPDEPDPSNPPDRARPEPTQSTMRDRQSIDRGRQQWEQSRDVARVEREDRERQRSQISSAGSSYGATPAASAAAASAVAAARQAARASSPSPTDTRQAQQEFVQREEQRQRHRVPEYDRLRQDEIRNRQSEEARRETDAAYNAQASASSAPYFPPTVSLPPSIYTSSSGNPAISAPSGVSMPTPSTTASSAPSYPVSSSYSGASHREFPQAASIPSSTQYHPPPASKPSLYPGQTSYSGPSPSPLPTPPYERPGAAESPVRYENSDSTDSDSPGNSLNQWRKTARSRQDGLPINPPSRSPSTYPPPVTTTSPPPTEHIQYPELMSQHQQKQGYTPSLNSMFTPDSKTPYPTPGNSLMLDHRSNNLYSTDMLPHPSSSVPPPSMPPAHHHQPSQSQSQPRYREPSPNPPGQPSYASRPPPPIPPPPRREEQSSRAPSPPSSSSDLKTVLLPRESLNRFLTIAKVNTSRNRETCGLLLGRPEGKKFKVTTLLIPKQHATSDTCTMDEEELVLQFTEDRGLITLGWIHTHPTQSCFMSSVDLHTHSGFQCMLPESFAVVCAPQSKPNFGIFRLTDPPGLQTILECTAKEAFHPHPDIPIYTVLTGDLDDVSLTRFDFYARMVKDFRFADQYNTLEDGIINDSEASFDLNSYSAADEHGSALLAYLSTIKEDVPMFQRLTISATCAHSQYCFPIISQLRGLRVLDLYINILGDLDHLEELRLDVDLSKQDVQQDPIVQCRSIPFGKLRRLFLDMGCEPRDVWAQFLNLWRVKSFELSCRSGSLEELTRSSSLRNLMVLRINICFDIMDADILNICNAWPQLTSLHIEQTPLCHEGDTALTIASLDVVRKRCFNLQHLGLPVNLLDLPATARTEETEASLGLSSLVPFHRICDVDLQVTAIGDEASEIALVLHLAFPNLCWERIQLRPSASSVLDSNSRQEVEGRIQRVKDRMMEIGIGHGSS
ncbi:hypothetical protein D9758_013891 [Tetrapyrgos nigripes]|uniref:MPN domain-containing protein n=1 Tax=Tetrapyrgos nigripes TaxID=182062 RepID=A0A8H5FQ15_9AGAR|nr:hypothetical protein D9758_013891 [Tetrapyrgos nigripes]